MSKRTASEGSETLRAAIYCRISQDQTGEQLGVKRQQEDCEALIKSQGWITADLYVDNDISASSGKTRPEYNRMVADIEASQIDAVVAWAPDRLYRKLRDLEPLIEVMERHGTTLKTVRGGEFDMGTPLGRMIARILASVATGEGEVKADRWKRSIRQRREAGVMPGSGPRMKGWTRDGQIIESEADEIRWMAQQIIDGMSFRRLGFEARDRGIVSTGGKIMTHQTIKKLLLNPRLAGHSVLKGEIIGTGQWPPILDTETWETVKALLTAAPTRGPLPRVSTLAGLIYCGGCGARMVTGSRTKKGGGLSRTYRCTRLPEGGGCMKVSMAAEVVEQVVEGYAEERLADPAVRARLEELRSVPKRELAEMGAMSTRLLELEHQLDDPSVPVDAIMRAMDRTKARLEELSKVVASSHTTALPTEGEPWPTDVPTRRAFVALVVSRVQVRPNEKPGVVDLSRIEIDPKV